MSTKRPYPETYTNVPYRAPRVATRSDGRVLVLAEPGFECRDRAVLHVCDSRLAREGFDDDGLLLISPEGGVFQCAEGAKLVAGIWLDSEERLWLVWSDEKDIQVRRSRESVGAFDDLTTADAWDSVAAAIEEGNNASTLHLGCGAVAGAGSLVVGLLELPAGRLHAVLVDDDVCESVVIHEHVQNHAPSVALDPDGAHAHFTWATEDLRILYRRLDLDAQQPTPNAQHSRRENDLDVGSSLLDVGCSDPVLVWSGCHNPDVASNGREVIVAYTGHMHNIKYGWFDGQEWQLDKHLTTLHPRFSETLEHSPWLWTDAGGAIHLSFVCLTRCLVFDSKWMGEGFSDPQPVEGLYHPSLYNDEVRVRAERMSLGRKGGTMLLSSSFLPERHGVYTQPVESIELLPDEALLMLDTDAIDELRNGEACLDSMQSDPEGPIFEPTGSKDDFDGSRVLKENGRYRMWYGACAMESEPGVPWYDQVYVGYAESDDGIAWQRVDTGNNHTFRGKPAPNRLRNVDHNACVFLDPEDVPERRYKAIKFENRAQRYDRAKETGELGYLGLPRRAWLSTSADGLQWGREEVVVDFPGFESYGFQPQAALYDPRDPDPERRYKVVGFTSLVGRRRGAALATSPDCRHWTVTERSPVLESNMAISPVRGAGPYAQLHDATMVRYGRYLLAFYQDQPGRNSADVRLAVSRNGYRFNFVFPETPLVPLGEPGTWNSGYLRPSSCIVDGDQVALYYCGNNQDPCTERSGLPYKRVCAGRAVTLRDRFVRVSPQTKSERMVLTTAPLSVASDKELHLEVNAKLSEASGLKVALVDADAPDRELDEYGLADALSLSGDDLHHAARWNNRDMLPNAGQRFRVRLFLDGTPDDAIYSITPC